MNVIALILFIIAAVIFLFATPLSTRMRLPALNLGLAVLTVGFIVEFCATKHFVTF